MKTIIRALGCCIIAVLVIEMCARVDDYISYGAPLFSPYNSETLYQQDSMGKRGKPNGRYKKWHLNSLGFRGPDLRPGTTRVLCFGSSETFGLYESPGEEYPRQLERQLNGGAESGPFQVLNVAYPGETIFTASQRIPEIVNEVHPRFAFVYPTPANYIWLPWLDAAANTKKTMPAQPRFEWRIAENVRTLLKQLIPGSIQTRLRAREIRHAVSEYTVMDRLPQANVDRFRRDLSGFVADLKSRGVEPILVTHATRFGSHLSAHDEDVLLSWRKFYPMLKEEGFLDMETRMNDAIRSIAAEQHVMLIDAAREMPPGDAYFADFVHFTDLGSHLMAEKLAAGLQEEIAREDSLQTASSGAPRKAVQ